ncbi:MAG: Tat pathway signal sequence, partial [Coriobacteriales bacterium]|nr:Tat pathway signal sequence [Coriobacteriales bacterium]
MARRNMTWQELIDSFNVRGAENASGGTASESGSGAGKSGSGSGSGGSGSGGSGSGSGGSGSGDSSSRQSIPNPFGELNDRGRRLLKRLLIIILIALIPIILGAYWWFHPAINIHSADAWFFVSVFVLLPLFLFFRIRSQLAARGTAKHPASTTRAKNLKRLSFIPVAVVAVGILGAILSSVIIPGNAERYSTILVTEENDFSADIQEVNYDEIPVIDRASAVLLGNRVMGAIPEFVSQFEISDLYSQINYRGHPVRVSPLGYADLFKWLNNREEGIPAYVLVDMTTQNTEIVKLTEPIRYSQSEPLMRNIDRHVQLSYPFYMFSQLSFEIDEDGKPWWVCPVQTRTIGLFGGTDIARVVLCDASTGETIDLAIEDCPTWVDRVYPAELLLEQYNWFGAYQNGWINSWLGQEGVVQTTPGTSGLPGYNYIAKDDDVWVYTGVTSAVADNSIVGFVLVNQRTAESHYYAIAGATEESAMYSAEGQVQHLGYTATFPLLLNINSQPTYFMALKDAAGLVKMYAMIDIQRYQNVAVGDTVASTQQVYQALLVTNGVGDEATGGESVEPAAAEKTSGVVARVAMAVI